MAIFIVDQFSLNTDLPLDIRYVPNGGSYNDVSAYWYPGMQVYQTSDQKIWYADNSLAWHPISEGIDASVNALYTLITDLSTYVTQQFGSTNASIGIINASIGDIYVRLQTLDASVLTLDSSVKALFDWQISQDSSIVALRNTDLSLDGSIVSLRNTDLIQDASIVALRNIVISLDGSIVSLRNTDLSQDASIVNLRQDIADLDTSLGLFVLKTGDTMTGPLTITNGGLVVNPGDVSIFGQLYVQNNAAIGGDLTINGSLYVVNIGSIDVSTAFIELNTGLTGAPPATLQSGIIIHRGTEAPYIFAYDEDLQTFRIGITQLETSTHYSDASTQAVATRQDAPSINGIAYWNDVLYRFDTSLGFTFNGNLMRLDASLSLPKYAGATDLALIVTPDGTVKAIATWDASINNLYTYIDGSLALRDASIANLNTRLISSEASIGTLDTSVNALFTRVNTIDASITSLNSSINQLFDRKDTSVLGAMNVGDSSAQIYAGLTNDGSLQFKGLIGSGAAIVSQAGNLITISIDASFGGEVNTASNIAGSDASIFSRKTAQDLEFKGLKAVNPSEIILTSDASFVFIDVSIASVTSLSNLTDVSTLNIPAQTHQVIELDLSLNLWKNTNNIWWDNSLGVTSNDFGSIPAGTNLAGLTLKEILFKMLYEYQVPVITAGSDPVAGIYEKGLVSTQFATVDVSYLASNANYPLAKLNNFTITKTGTGTILDVSLGLINSSTGVFVDTAGITNWGGTSRTINYNLSVSDDQPGKPAVSAQDSFTFYYKQYWGTVNGNTLPAQVNSAMITGLANTRLAGESDLSATFANPGGFVKYLFAYPDTVAIPDNFGTLSQIIDQNQFEMVDSFTTENEDVSVGLNNVRYRFYLLKNKVDTSTFNITFKF